MTYIKIFTDFQKDLERLSNAECGRLFLAMLHYGETGEELRLWGAERYLWPGVRKDLDRDRENYQKQCERNRRNARRGKPRDPEDSPPAEQPPEHEAASVEAGRCEWEPVAASGVQDKDKDKDKDEDEDEDEDEDKDEDKDKYKIQSTIFSAPEGAGKKGQQTLDLDVSEFSPMLAQAVSDWLGYKAERRQGYQVTGLQAFLDEVRLYAAHHGDEAVSEVIRRSMAANYQGVIFNSLDGKAPPGNTQARGAANAAALSDSGLDEWEAKVLVYQRGNG